MEYNYNKLWKLLIDKNLMKKDLMEKTGITSSTIAKMGKNKAVSMEVLGKIIVSSVIRKADLSLTMWVLLKLCARHWQITLIRLEVLEGTILLLIKTGFLNE